jgi:PAS domain S-box-containing protein
MEKISQTAGGFDPKHAIAPLPPLVTPDIALTEAIILISQARANTCELSLITQDSLLGSINPYYQISEESAGCIFVMGGEEILGIVTQRDIVKLAALGKTLTAVTVGEVMISPVLTLKLGDFTEIFAALNLLHQYKIRHLPIVDELNHPIGIVTPQSIRQTIELVDLLKFRQVSEVMNTQVIHAPGNTTILELAQLMTENRVSCIVIVEENSPLIALGIVTERDIVQFQAFNVNMRVTHAATVMSYPLFCLNPETSLWVAHQQMQQQKVQELVVKDSKGQLVGIVTQTSLLQVFNAGKIYRFLDIFKIQIKQLETEKITLVKNQNSPREEPLKKRTIQLQDKAEREDILMTLSSRIRASLQREETLNTIVTEIRAFLKCDRVLVYQFDELNQEGNIIAESVEEQWTKALGSQIQDICFAKYHIISTFYRGKKATANIYNAGLSKCYIELLEKFQVKANLVVPLLVKDNVWGLLIAHQCDRPRQWHSSELDLLDKLSVQIAIAIEQVEAYEKSQKELEQRQITQKQLQKTNRSLRMISLCNNALIYSQEEKTLLQTICQLIVEVGGYRLAWVGYREEDENKSVKPFAHFGYEEGYLESLNITWADTERGRGPTGMVIRTGQTYIIKNIQSNPHFAPWREEATKRGYQSSIALPLKDHLGKTFASINIYAKEPNSFDMEEVELLTELADNISYGVFSIRAKIERSQAETALRESEERFRQLAENIHEVFYLSHVEPFEMLYVSPGYERIWQRTCQSVYQQPKSFLDSIHPEDQEGVFAAIQRQMQGEVTQQEYRIIRPDGSIRWINDSSVPIIDQTGKVYRICGVAEDITERIYAQEALRISQARFAGILEIAKDAIISVDENQRIILFNQGAEKIFSYSSGEILGKPLDILLPQRFISAHREHLCNFGTIKEKSRKMGENSEVLGLRKDGKEFPCEASISKLEIGKEVIFTVILRDITERKQAQDALQQLNSELEVRVEQRTAALRDTNEQLLLTNAQLARATRLKDEFLANMSHELRTPLNAILGMSEVLLEEVYAPLTDRQKKALTTIKKSGRHLLELINDILDLSKIESGKVELELQSVSVSHLCDSSLTFVKQQANQKNIQIKSNVPKEIGEVIVDERRMRQVLLNLLNNAVKFTPHGGRVMLEVEADNLAKTISFRVKDTGIGIAPDDIGKLFQAFVQVDSSLTRNYSGTGLGLALVRRIAELHDGSVSVESEVGKGSCFTVILPLKRAIPHPTPVNLSLASHCQYPLENSQVLVIEDSSSAAEQITRYLYELGMQGIIYPVGDRALEFALELSPSLIILDIELPSISGWEILAQFQANPQTKDIPVLIVSVVDERAMGLSQGAREYLVKPFSREEFKRALNQIWCDEKTPAIDLVLVPESVSHPSAPKILIAEDNDENIDTLMAYFLNHGYQFILAKNGLEAVELAKSQKPQLILMDILMPKMDGLTAIRTIREDPALSHVPIIALTALAMSDDREKCLDAGANEYLTKPVRGKILLNLIQHLLNRSEINEKR